MIALSVADHGEQDVDAAAGEREQSTLDPGLRAGADADRCGAVDYVYTGSIDDGAVYRGRVGAKTLEPFLPGGQDGRTQATGIKIDGDRLLVAGAFTGRFFVYTDTGKLVSSYTVPNTGEKTLVNDAAVAPDGDVYLTDSFRPVVYRIPAAEVHAPATGTHRTLKVVYRLPDYVAGQSNGNGITTAPTASL